MATITISVNIAEGNKWDGDADFRLDIPEKDFISLDRNQLATEIVNRTYLFKVVDEALEDYEAQNLGVTR